jgi:hypothetical protein
MVHLKIADFPGDRGKRMGLEPLQTTTPRELSLCNLSGGLQENPINYIVFDQTSSSQNANSLLTKKLCQNDQRQLNFIAT